MTARDQDRRQRGLCTSCGARPPSPGYTHCLPCRRTRARRRIQRQSERRTLGLCPLCGRLPAPGRLHCYRCLARHQRDVVKYRSKRSKSVGQ